MTWVTPLRPRQALLVEISCIDDVRDLQHLTSRILLRSSNDPHSSRPNNRFESLKCYIRKGLQKARLSGQSSPGRLWASSIQPEGSRIEANIEHLTEDLQRVFKSPKKPHISPTKLNSTAYKTKGQKDHLQMHILSPSATPQIRWCHSSAYR